MFKPNHKKLNANNKKFAFKWEKADRADMDKSEVILTLKQKIKNIAYQYLEEKGEIELPKKNEMIRIVVKRIPSETFIYKICETEVIEELTIGIFSISKKIILSLSNLIDEKRISENVNILVSDMWAKLKRENDYLFLQENLPTANIGTKRIHVKIMLARTNKGNFYVYEGSGNLSTNTNYEQYIFENRKESYDFHYNWITDFIKN